MQNPSSSQADSQAAARKAFASWLRAFLIVILIGLPTALFIQAGRQIDLNRNLIQAIRRNDANTVDFLLSAGADANTREPLHDNRSMLQKIYAQLRGIPAPQGISALQIHLSTKSVPIGPGAYAARAAQPENIEIARALLEHHADPNLLRSFGGRIGDTPLMMAVQQQKDQTIQLLLKYGANVHQKDPLGADALHRAVASAESAEVGLLLDAGADVNGRDSEMETPLTYAVFREDGEMVKLLIARGADVNTKDGDESLLTSAIHSNLHPMIPLLKAAGAK